MQQTQPPAETIAELAVQLNQLRRVYNHERPHRALDRRTPAQAYNTEPKAAPSKITNWKHHRIRIDKIDSTGKVTLRYAGKLRHLGTGRHNTGKRVIMLIKDADVTITELSTGEILGDYTIDPNRNYQPKKKQP